MADELTDENGAGAGGEVMGDEGVAQIIDLGASDASSFEVAVNGRSDVSN